MIRQNKEQVADNAEAHRPASEQELEVARSSAHRLWKEIRRNGTEAVSQKDGMSARFDHSAETAHLTHRDEGSTQWTTTTLGFDERGTWFVTRTDFEPANDGEKNERYVGHTTIRQLVPGEKGHEYTNTYLQEDGVLTVDEPGETTVLDPLNATEANELQERFGGLADEAVLRRTLGMFGAAVDLEIKHGPDE